MEDLNVTTNLNNQPDITDISRVRQTMLAKYSFILSDETFTNIHYILSHKIISTNLQKFNVYIV